MQPTVLIIDDSLTVRMDLIEAFESAGFRALASGSAAEARILLAKESINVIILDRRLPDVDGTELLKEIRLQPGGSELSILMLSTEAEVKDRIHGLQIGADEYVGKPYDIGYVIAKAQTFMRKRGVQAVEVPNILIIDDSITFREELREALESHAYRVSTAASGEEGLRIAGRLRPAMIIVDGVLPGIDGPTVIRHVRLDAALRGVPCVLLTGSGERGAELLALDAGADAFLCKDQDFSVILAKLAAILRGATSNDSGGGTDSLQGPKRILAVDDSITYLHELTDSLRGEGYDVVMASSGNEALDLLAVQPTDCILLDLVMPGLSGQETCRLIKAAPVVRDIPLIMLTSLEDRDAMIVGLGAGADDYIMKSSSFDILKARVRAQMRRKQFEDENRRIRDQLLRRELEALEARAARELAETKAALVDELQRKNEELEAFSYSVSHDLRAPLRSINGFSHILLDEYSKHLDEQGNSYLNRVCKATHRMSELIDDLLQLSHVNNLTMKVRRSDITELVQSVSEDLARRDPDRNVSVVISEQLSAEVDPNLLRIVLENLIGNARKFSAKSESPRIECGSSKRGNDVIFFVRDNGAGFDSANASRLFQPFQRLHQQSDYPGTGIGLATVRRIIERHGGRIWAESEIGKGATFFFTLSKAIAVA